jgi:hypothetical protein
MSASLLAEAEAVSTLTLSRPTRYLGTSRLELCRSDSSWTLHLAIHLRSPRPITLTANAVEVNAPYLQPLTDLIRTGFNTRDTVDDQTLSLRRHNTRGFVLDFGLR